MNIEAWRRGYTDRRAANLLGIDPSLTGTAWCWLGRKGRIIDQARIDTAKLRGAERLCHIEHELSQIADMDLRLIAIEGYSFGSQGRAVFQIGELGGVLRRLFFVLKIPCLEIPPAVLKKFATGKGNARKDEVMLNVYRRWGVECGNSDQADAYVLARIGWTLVTGAEADLTAEQMAALVKLREPFKLLGV